MKKLYLSCLNFWILARDSRWRESLVFQEKTKQIKRKSSNKIGMSAGFSLTELLTVVGIMAVLTAVALPTYFKYKRKAIQGRMQHELADVKKSLAYAYSVDGGYHQRIYTAGYTPDQQLIAEVGFKYTRIQSPCCSIFPSNYNTGNFSRFFTITSETAGINSSIRASQICDAGGKCKVDSNRVPTGSGVNNVRNRKLNAMPLSGCGNKFKNKAFICNCEQYKIYAINKWGSGNLYLLADQAGRFCASTDGSTGKEF